MATKYFYRIDRGAGKGWCGWVEAADDDAAASAARVKVGAAAAGLAVELQPDLGPQVEQGWTRVAPLPT